MAKELKSCMGDFEGWPNRAWPSYPFWQKSADWLNWLSPVRPALKRTPVQDFNSFSIIFYYFINTTNQKIRDLFCPVHISGLSKSVSIGDCSTTCPRKSQECGSHGQQTSTTPLFLQKQFIAYGSNEVRHQHSWQRDRVLADLTTPRPPGITLNRHHQLWESLWLLLARGLSYHLAIKC